MYPIYTYLILTITLPVILRLISRKLTWFSIILAVITEIIIYWNEFCYYESRGIIIYITIIQVATMSIVCILLNLLRKKVIKN